MSLFKRGKYWFFDFIHKGRRYQGSSHQTNINKAKLVEAKVRSDAALERFGIVQPKSEPFRTFMEGRFRDHVHRHAKAKRTALSYDANTRRLLRFPLWSDLNLSDIDEELIGKYSDFRARTVAVATVNGELATLRKALNLAYEWRLLTRRPRIRRLPGEKSRTFVVSVDLEAAYLREAPYPLKQAAILILDLGLRPEECMRLRKEDISQGVLTVRDGKSINAARALPLTQRASCQIELLSALWPDSEWLFKGSKGKHYTRGALDNLHTKVWRAFYAKLSAAAHHADSGPGVLISGMPARAEEFVLYSFRHTFATRLAESGCNPFEMKTLLGHYDIRMSQRYVHLSGEGLFTAMRRKELMDRIIRGEIVPEISTTPDREPKI